MDPLDRQQRGKRTLLATLERKIKQYPEHVFGAVPLTSEVRDGFRDVTYREIGQSVDAAAHLVQATYGKCEDDGTETIMYLGVNDLRYAVAFFAFQKCGYRAQYVAAVNPTDHNVKLLQEASCHKCFYSPELQGVVSALQKAMPELEGAVLPPIHDLIKSYKEPFRVTKEHSMETQVAVFHSSGSTGPPHPVFMPNGYFTCHDIRFAQVPGKGWNHNDIYERINGDKRIFSPIPAYHLSGFLNMIVWPVFEDTVNVLWPIGARPNGQMIKDILELQHVKQIYSAPATFEQVASLPGGIDALAKLDFLEFVGAPLAPSIAARLKDHCTIIHNYGSTEAGAPIFITQPPEDMLYLEMHPDFDPIWEPVVDGASELVWRRGNCKQGPWGFEYTLPDDEVHRTKDLFKPHPTKPGLWRFYGRTDDVLVLSNGGKVNPVGAEMAIAGHPKVSDAMIVGQGRYPTAVLIEPKLMIADTDQKAFVEELWPTIEAANETLVDWARLRRDKVAVMEPGSFVRAPKGTAVRRSTANKFSEVIEVLCC